VIHEYRHVKMLKRAGRGHDPAGAIATLPGECAVLCPACPHKFTVADDWKSAPPDKQYDINTYLLCMTANNLTRFLHTLFLALDANFRLKRRKVSTDTADPGLSKGWSYFVEETMFKSFLNQFDSKIIQEVFILLFFWLKQC